MVYLFLFAHLVADFILQPLWLVLRKRRWDGLLIHGGVVLLCMLALPLFDPATLALWPAMLGITAVHIAADRWKVCHGDRLLQPPIVPFLLDQAIHVTTIAVALSLMLPAGMVWDLEASALAPLMVYASVYIVAAFATPIAVIVWLDPTFRHATLAGQARARSLVAGATTTSLALFGGAIALPATLIGLLLITRRPVSPHPLDMPAGLLVVLSVASALGAALTILI